jgi:DNA-binding IclR family transcriptional regulator
MSSTTFPVTRHCGAPALDKGLDILEHWSNEMAPLSQLEIARALGRTPSKIHRMLMCLEERGYVTREEGSGKFRLTLRLYQLSHWQNSTTLLRKAAREYGLRLEEFRLGWSRRSRPDVFAP